MITSLQDLKDVDFELKEFAKEIVKYQNFKTRVYMERTSPNRYKNSTRRQMFDAGARYLETGVKLKNVAKKLYKYIDEAVDEHVQPLTPSESDKRMKQVGRTNTSAQKKDSELPVTRLVKSLTNDKPMTESYYYGVQLNDTVKVFVKQAEAMQFMNGITFVNPEADVHMVSVKPLFS